MSGFQQRAPETPTPSSEGSSRTGKSALMDWVRVTALVLLFAWYPLQYMHFANVEDPDVWWHMRTGEWILQHHAVPRVDPFSASTMGKPWVAYSWLFEVLLYLFSTRWDLLGIVAYKVLTCLAITAAFYHLMRSVTGEFWRAWILTLLGSVGMAHIYSPRPGMFTTLFFILVLDLLLTVRRTGETGRLWLLPLILLLWANIHVQFVYGLFVIGLFCLEPIFNRMFRTQAQPQIFAVKMWGLFAASALATLANPYGVGVYKVLCDYARQPQLAQLVTETQPMRFDNWINRVVLAVALAAVVAVWKCKPRVPLFGVLLLWALFSAIRVERDVWLLVTVSCFLIGMAIARDENQSSTLPRRLQWVSAAVLSAVVLLGFRFIAPTNQEILSRISRVLPLGSAAYIHEHRLTGPIFNDFNWGGFLIYVVPDIPPSIDGRTNVHNAEQIERSWNTWNMGPRWEQDPYLEQANIVLGDPNRALTKALMTDPRFRPVFDDGVSVLFERIR